MTRGIRNNNPLNIRHSADRWVGARIAQTDPGFVQFVSMAYGYRAIFVLLDSYRRKYGLCTIRQMLNRYAPPSENFTEGYVRYVVAQTGIAPDESLDTLSPHDMVPFVAAISKVENGVAARMADVWAGWGLFEESVAGR